MAVVRIAFGAVVALSAVRTWWYGWTDSLYADPTHRLTYLWLDWVPQPGPLGIRLLVATTFAAGVAVALGWRTRIACAVVLVSFSWVELIDASTYLNHYWFVTLLAALGVVVPFGAALGVDARHRRRALTGGLGATGPRGDRDGSVARGWIWLLRFQVAVVYVSAGVAKLRADWLLRARPLTMWLPARADLPVVGPLLEQPTTAHVASIAGAAFDCLVVPALLWRRTRPFAYAAVVAFHVTTWLLFPIGVFPWLMIAMATVFFEPSWPRSAWRRVSRLVGGGRVRPPDVAPDVPLDGADVLHDRADDTRATASGGWRARALAVAVGVWVVVQVALPLRHLAYPGDHRWTAEGYRFGWNVLLVERMGSVTFLVHDPETGRTWAADPARLYSETQLRVLRSEPDLIQQAARAIAADEAERGHPGVEVRVDAWMSLNGRPAARWIDPTVDLAAEPSSPWAKEWMLPSPDGI